MYEEQTYLFDTHAHFRNIHVAVYLSEFLRTPFYFNGYRFSEYFYL